MKGWRKVEDFKRRQTTLTKTFLTRRIHYTRFFCLGFLFRISLGAGNTANFFPFLVFLAFRLTSVITFRGFLFFLESVSFRRLLPLALGLVMFTNRLASVNLNCNGTADTEFFEPAPRVKA